MFLTLQYTRTMPEVVAQEDRFGSASIQKQGSMGIVPLRSQRENPSFFCRRNALATTSALNESLWLALLCKPAALSDMGAPCP